MVSVPVATAFRLPFPRSSLGGLFGILPNSKFYGPQGHRGVDFRQPGVTPVTPVAPGLVTDVLWSDALGNVVVVRHNPAAGPDVYSFSCHLSRVRVREGQTVKATTRLGDVGTTGWASSGNHLHLAMSLTPMGGISGTVFDPVDYVDAHQAKPAGAPARAAYTTARRGEGLQAVADRVKVPLARVVQLNPSVDPPEYVVRLGQRLRYR